jgi:hypothetical protein
MSRAPTPTPTAPPPRPHPSELIMALCLRHADDFHDTP